MNEGMMGLDLFHAKAKQPHGTADVFQGPGRPMTSDEAASPGATRVKARRSLRSLCHWTSHNTFLRSKIE